MTSIRDGELLDLLPARWKSDTEMSCLSYALKVATRQLLEYEGRTMAQCLIDGLPEKVLDTLAVELRSPYYDQGMGIDAKRDVIKGTLVWHIRAGTASAVSEMVAAVFGEGEVVEWFDFTEGGKEPGTFDIITGARMTEDMAARFEGVVQRAKNERSHVRRVLTVRKVGMDERSASGASGAPRGTITNHPQSRDGTAGHELYASSIVSSPRNQVGDSGAEGTAASGPAYAAAVAASSMRTVIQH